jgi:hypothetical protein
LDVHFGRSHKHGGIIRIERRSKDDATPPKLVEEANPCSFLEDLSDGIDGKDKKERQERITLTEAPTMVNGHAGNAIKEHPGSGGGK